MTEIETKVHKRENVLIDVRVEADLSGMIWTRRGDTEEQRAKDLEGAVKDFHDFLRDHRSQDMVTLDVVRVHKDICSGCGEVWQAETIDGKESCMCCGAEVAPAKGDCND